MDYVDRVRLALADDPMIADVTEIITGDIRIGTRYRYPTVGGSCESEGDKIDLWILANDPTKITDHGQTVADAWLAFDYGEHLGIGFWLDQQACDDLASRLLNRYRVTFTDRDIFKTIDDLSNLPAIVKAMAEACLKVYASYANQELAR